MEERVLLKRSPRGLEAQLGISALVTLLICLLAVWLFGRLFHWTESGGWRLQALTCIVLFLLWVFAALRLWYSWKIKRYEIGRDALIVHAKAGKLGTAQTIYRYESIISIRMTQGFLGKQFGYGDIRVTIPKLEHEVVMNDIEHPVEQLEEIQRRMGGRIDNVSATAALIN